MQEVHICQPNDHCALCVRKEMPNVQGDHFRPIDRAILQEQFDRNNFSSKGEPFLFILVNLTSCKKNRQSASVASVLGQQLWIVHNSNLSKCLGESTFFRKLQMQRKAGLCAWTKNTCSFKGFEFCFWLSGQSFVDTLWKKGLGLPDSRKQKTKDKAEHMEAFGCAGCTKSFRTNSHRT